MILSLLLLLSTDMTDIERRHSFGRMCAELSSSIQNHPDLRYSDRQAMMDIERRALQRMDRNPSNQGLSLEHRQTVREINAGKLEHRVSDTKVLCEHVK